MKNETIFTGHAQMVVDTTPGQAPQLREVNFNLDIDAKGPLDLEAYIKDEVPTGAGIKALTNCFVLGLAANVKAAAVGGNWDQQAHIDYIITELSRAITAETIVRGGKNYFR